MQKYKFELGSFVKLHMSGEKGQIRGRAEYIDTENNYYVRYVATDGRQVETWQEESALIIDDAA